MKKTALITGASSGIGKAFAHIFAREGYNLVLVARNEQRLMELKKDLGEKFNCTSKVFIQDLSEIDAAQQLYSRVQDAGLMIDALINNAGFGDYGEFAQMDEQKMSNMIQVNVTALTQLTRLFLPKMKERGKGKILNVASTAGFQPGPYMAVYFATKAYVLSFSEALYSELGGTGIAVTALCPGPTRTGFEKGTSKSGNPLFQGGLMDAQTVAQRGFDGLMNGKRLVIPGAKNNALVLSGKFSPRSVVLKIMKSLLKR